MSSLKSQGAKALIWDMAGKFATHGMGFVVSVFLARLLTPTDFGLVAMVMVIIGIAGIFADVGLGAALIQRRRVLPIHYTSVFFFNVTVGTLLTLITFSSAPLIAAFYQTDALIPLAQAISFSFIIGAFSAVQTTKLRKELNYALLTKIGFSASLLSGAIGIFLAVYGAGVWALVAQTLTQGMIYNLLIWYLSHWKPSLQFSLKALMQLWAFGFHMFLSGLLNTVFASLDTLIIGKIFPPATLGYFNRAKSLNQMIITYSSGSLMSVLFPVLSKVQRDLPRFQNIIIKSMGIIVFVTFFLLGGMYLVSHELVIMLFGEKWLQTVDYFKILVLSGFAFPISALLVNVLSSRGNSKSYLKLEIYKKMLIPFNMSILYFYGVESFLYFLVLTSCIAVYLNIIFASKELLLSKWVFVKPIVIQMVITVCITVFLEYLNKGIDYPLFALFVLKGGEYLILYIIMNQLLKTDAYSFFMAEFRVVYGKRINKIN